MNLITLGHIRYDTDANGIMHFRTHANALWVRKHILSQYPEARVMRSGQGWIVFTNSGFVGRVAIDTPE